MKEDVKSSDDSTKIFEDFKTNDPVVRKAYLSMQAAYKDLQTFRSNVIPLKTAYYNPFIPDTTLTVKTTKPNILRSHFIPTASEEFQNGMRFPEFKIEAKDRTSDKSKTLESMAMSVIEYGIRISGFEDVYQESKFRLSAFGDSYRRPYATKVNKRKKRGEKTPKSYLARSGDEMRMQYEDLNGENLLFDVYAIAIKSENIANSISWWGHTQIYNENSLVRKFGKWILKYAKPGALIDVDRLSDAQGTPNGKELRQYEVIEFQNSADEVELSLVGEYGFPAVRQVADDDTKPKEAYENNVNWTSEYTHYDSYARPYLTLQNNFFYWDGESIRNRGLTHKLYNTQIGHEMIENAKLDSTRKRMHEILAVSGGRPDVIKAEFEEYEARANKNLRAFMHFPQNASGMVPTTSTIKFEGVSADEGAKSTEDIHSFARDSIGISLNRLDVPVGIGVGQSEILEGDKVKSIESIINSNVANLRREFIGILDYIINMGGFNSDEQITYTKYEKTEGFSDGEVKFKMPEASISIKEAAKKLEEFQFELYIDRNSIVNRTQLTMLDKLIKYSGLIDPAAMPNVAKAISQRIASVMRIDIPAEDFEGIENSRAMGGDSQFQSVSNNQPINEEIPAGVPANIPTA